MRVVHVLSSLNVGGAERFGIDLASEQRKMGFEVGILSMGADSDPLLREAKCEKLVVIVERSISALRRCFNRFDVVHVHSTHCLLRALVASKGLNVRLIYTHHNARIPSALKDKMVFRYAKGRIHKAIFVIRETQESFSKEFRYLQPISVTIANGVPKVAGSKTASRKVRVGIVGRFEAIKAHHSLLKGLALLPSETRGSIHVNFFGTGELLAEVKARANSLLRPEIDLEFHGTELDRTKIYEEIDILAVTSETEGMSLSILEALSSGTPVIASNVGGNSLLVRHGANGFLYERGDHYAFASYLKALIRDRELYSRFSTASVQLFDNFYTMPICAAAYTQAYE